MSIKNWLLPNKLTIKAGDTVLDIPLSRFRKNLEEAQKWLVFQVAADCNNFIPFRDGSLRQSLTFPEGEYGTDIEWNAPYAHYQYMGEVYINPKHGAAGFIGSDGMWHGWKGPKAASGRPITYHTAGTGDHWFDRAAEAYGDEWVKGVKKIARFL